MRYLLDVNVLLALAMAEHEFHARVVLWMKGAARKSKLRVATCAITELGFIRILAQPVYGYSIREARQLLSRIKAIPALDFAFFPDASLVETLPSWVVRPGQVTDGHLAALAEAHGARLLTLDGQVPGAYLVPEG